MSFSFKKLGNFFQFWKEEWKNFLYVLWIGFYGACMIILINLQKTPELFDNILPTDINKAPYEVDNEVKKKFGMLKYLFSYESDFPYNLNSGMEGIDLYLKFIGGMVSVLFSSFRSSMKETIEYMNLDYYIVDVFVFYALPTILFYLALMPIIPMISFCIINFISCFTQPKFEAAYIIAYAFIFNFMDPEYIKSMSEASMTQLPGVLFKYLLNILYGCLISFVIVPGFSALSSVCVWGYIVAFLKAMPLFLVYIAGISWKDFFKKLLEQFGNHFAGLTILFLYYSIAISYKNLDQKIAWGSHIGIIVLIIMLLNIIGMIKNLYRSITGTELSNPFSSLNIPPVIAVPVPDKKL